MYKKIALSILTAISAIFIISTPASALTCVPAPEPPKCTSILPESWCKENGVWGILNLVLAIMTAGIGVLATIGIVVCGLQYLTARDKEDQIVKAKNRMLNIVIGLLAYGIMWLFLQWITPGGILTNNLQEIVETPHGIGGCPPGQMPDPTQPTETDDSPNPSSPSLGPPSSTPIGDPQSSSVDIPCPQGTIDLDVHDGWENGRRTDYRLCFIKNLPSHRTDYNRLVLEKANHPELYNVRGAILNSRVAGAANAMAVAANGLLHVGSTFRSFDTQMDICDLTSESVKNELIAARNAGYVKKDSRYCNDSQAAKPGYSNHQSGTAIDFRQDCGSKASDCDNAMYKWIKAHASEYGFRGIASEYWHYSAN